MMTMQLVATSQPQLEAAHDQMLAWSQQQQAACSAELGEEQQALEIATTRKWATARHRKNVRELERRVQFYRKIELAVEAGYVIVPNLAMDVFAVRTDIDRPRGSQSTESKHWLPDLTQQAKLLPAGTGEYRNPEPAREITTDVTTVQGKEVARYIHEATDFAEIDFPFALAKPALMAEVSDAMRERIFDEIGVAVDQGMSGRGDPVLIGRILNPRRGRPAISFFLGWFFDVSRL
jgi:hypothetical protein